jgi:hypothetical protein
MSKGEQSRTAADQGRPPWLPSSAIRIRTPPAGSQISLHRAERSLGEPHPSKVEGGRKHGFPHRHILVFREIASGKDVIDTSVRADKMVIEGGVSADRDAGPCVSVVERSPLCAPRRDH